MTLGAVRVEIRRLANGADLPLPSYATAGSAGMDLMAAVETPLTLLPGARALVPTGIALALPAGYEAQLRPRSGLALKHGVALLNSPGTVDSDYRGEVKVILVNHGAEPYLVERGARIAQLVVAPVAQVTWSERGELDNTDRETGGFGSTGFAAVR